MKKVLLSFMALSLVAFAGIQTLAATATPSKAAAAAEAIVLIVNDRGEEYSVKFFELFAGLIEKYREANDDVRVAILDEMEAVFAEQALYYPQAEADLDTDVDADITTILSCYDNSVVPSICNHLYQPMCGEDGATYGNACEMDAAVVEMAHEGECTEEDKPIICTLEYAPVCGSDGKTYGNFCGLKASDARYLFDGACEDHQDKLTCVEIKTPADPLQKPCTREYFPVCGTDGNTYSNICMMENAGVELAAEGSC